LLGDALATLDDASWHNGEQGFLRFYPQLMRFSEQQLAHYRETGGHAGLRP
jgi:hypothetical protein